MATANDIYGWYKDFFDRKELHYTDEAEGESGCCRVCRLCGYE